MSTSLKVPVNEHDHAQGPADAPVTLVEYGDYQCPHCGHAHPIVKRIQKRYSGSLRFVFRNFPLRQIHEYAEIAAESAEFAAAHGKFWEMHDALYEKQSMLSPEFLIELAEGLGLAAAELRPALETGEFADRVNRDFMGGVRSGVNGTPTFFINGVRHDGSFEYDSLAAAIERQLNHVTTR
jgi:protein-disulfide isomerase